MNGKVVLGVLSVIGTLALSATVAQAGGHGTPVPLTSFFVCHATTGANPNLGKQVTVKSDDLGIERLIQIGQAVLACAQANLFHTDQTDPVTGEAIEIGPNTVSSVQAELRCYSASPVPKKSKLSNDVTLDDKLSDIETIPVAQDIQLVCGPANQTQPPD